MDLPKFKNHLVQIWDDIPMEVIRAACDAFRKRLKAVIKEKGDRFELKS